jgi:hypothetical protein
MAPYMGIISQNSGICQHKPAVMQHAQCPITKQLDLSGYISITLTQWAFSIIDRSQLTQCPEAAELINSSTRPPHEKAAPKQGGINNLLFFTKDGHAKSQGHLKRHMAGYWTRLLPWRSQVLMYVVMLECTLTNRQRNLEGHKFVKCSMFPYTVNTLLYA